MKLLKRLRQRCPDVNVFFHALLTLQNTPKRGCSFSPAQNFLGRSQRTLLQPQVKQCVAPWAMHHAQRVAMHQRDFPLVSDPESVPLLWRPGDDLVVRTKHDPMVPAVYVGPAAQPRASLVRFASGIISTRNNRFLSRPLTRSPMENCPRMSTPDLMSPPPSPPPLMLPSPPLPTLPDPVPPPAGTRPNLAQLPPPPSPPSNEPRNAPARGPPLGTTLRGWVIYPSLKAQESTEWDARRLLRSRVPPGRPPSPSL